MNNYYYKISYTIQLETKLIVVYKWILYCIIICESENSLLFCLSVTARRFTDIYTI